MYSDKTLNCRDCGEDFVFSASEQEFYAEKGFSNEPGRCIDCRAKRKQNSRNSGGSFGRREREMHTATCSACGVETQVPFKPSGDKPVYCRECFTTNKSRY